MSYPGLSPSFPFPSYQRITKDGRKRGQTGKRTFMS